MDEVGYNAALIEIDGLLRRELDAEEDRRLDELFDEVERYEDEHFEIPDAPPSDVLRLLMESNRLTAEDVAARSGIAATAIRDFLRGEIVPTLAQAVDLGKSFHVGPGVFWDREAMEDRIDTAKAKAAIDAGEPTVPWDDLKAELGIDCSDIPEITGLGPRLERDAEGRLIREFDVSQAMETRRERAEIACRELQEAIDARLINRERRSTST